MIKLNELLGTEFPIIQGGMANIATGEFAAACSNAGALGVIGAPALRRCTAGGDSHLQASYRQALWREPHAHEPLRR